MKKVLVVVFVIVVFLTGCKCRVNDCDNEEYKNGYCARHYGEQVAFGVFHGLFG